MRARVTFYGGTGSVTGANFLLDIGDKRILVDCGTQEVERVCDDVNTAPFLYDPRSIDALVVTHAHQDHIGRIPRLVRAGYRGPIYSTPATRDLSAVMFDDALAVSRSHALEHGCEVPYETEHIAQAMAQWQGIEYHAPLQVGSASIELLDAGHILGSSLVKVSRPGRAGAGRAILFTGDLGNMPEPLLRDTESPAGVQYLVMESVYGDRVHEGRQERKTALRHFVEDSRARGGVLLIPSFSIERTQILLFELNEMVEEGAMQPIPVYLDAPLATKVTGIFRAYPQLFNEHVREHFTRGDDPFSFRGLKVTVNKGESREIYEADDPKVIIAGAGMSGGGRVRSHEQQYLGVESTTLLFVGYQAPGSLGRRILDGEKHITIDGKSITVRAQIAQLTGYSGHADRDQLLDFVEKTRESLEKVFITMGEPKSSLFLAQRIKDFLNVNAIVPEKGSAHDIEL